MARMYSRNKGKSGSHTPPNKKATWVSHKPGEVEEIVANIAKKGKTSAQIGLVLRDQYGIPSVKAVNGKKMNQILKKKEITTELPDDMLNLMKKAVSLRAHLESNKHDLYSKRGLELTESKIRRLGKYYKGKKTLPDDWNYNPEKAKLLVK